MKTNEELRSYFDAINTDPRTVPEMIYSVYSDGEVASEKCACGELLGQRSLHCIAPGLTRRLPHELFPHVTNSFGFVYVRTKDDALAVRKVIIDQINNAMPRQPTVGAERTALP